MPARTAEPGRRTHDSAGVATVWAIAWIFALVMLGGIGLALGFAVSRQHQLDAAADLTALSAAARLQDGRDFCAAAAEVARANHVELVDCHRRSQDVVIAVRARIALPFGLGGWVSAQARAGPS